MTCFCLFLSFSNLTISVTEMVKAVTNTIFVTTQDIKNIPLNIHHIVADLILGHNVWCGISEQGLDHLP